MAAIHMKRIACALTQKEWAELRAAIAYYDTVLAKEGDPAQDRRNALGRALDALKENR